MTWVLKRWIPTQGDQGWFQESSHESVGSVLGRAMFQESSHENHMLGSGLGVVSRLGS